MAHERLFIDEGSVLEVQYPMVLLVDYIGINPTHSLGIVQYRTFSTAFAWIFRNTTRAELITYCRKLMDISEFPTHIDGVGFSSAQTTSLGVIENRASAVL